MSQAERLSDDQSQPDDLERREDKIKSGVDKIVRELENQLESLVEWKRRVERIGPHVDINPEDFKDIWLKFTKLATLEAFDKLSVLMGGPEASDEVVVSLFPKNEN